MQHPYQLISGVYMEKFLLFLDIDGVFNKEHGYSISKPLNTVITKFSSMLKSLQQTFNIEFKIIWNTSHSVIYKTEDKGLLKLLIANGLTSLEPFCLYDDTLWYTNISRYDSRKDSINNWFDQHPQYKGYRYLAIDDNHRKYQGIEMFPVYFTFSERGMITTDVIVIKNIISKWLGKRVTQRRDIISKYNQYSRGLIDRFNIENSYRWIVSKTIHNILLTEKSFEELFTMEDVWTCFEEWERLFLR